MADTVYCIWCHHFSVDVSCREVGCGCGVVIRFYKGEGYKRRCSLFSGMNDKDANENVLLLEQLGYRDMIVPWEG